MRAARLFAAAVLAVTGLVAVGATTESASANSLVLTAQYPSVMKYETFTLSGKVITPKVRTVKLQYKSGSSWVDKATTSSAASGNFSFSTFTAATRTYRYYAPASGSSPAITGAAKKVTIAAQSMKAYVTPNSRTFICGATSQTLYAVADVLPVRTSRSVSFTSPNGELVSKSTDSAGHVVLPFTFDKGAGTYSVTVTAAVFNGASAVSAAPTTITVRVIPIC